RAVRMIREADREDGSTEYQLIGRVAKQLGIAEETLRRWVRKAEVDSGERQGTTSAENAEIKRLRKELAEAKRANEILRTASAFFAAEIDRPTPR
ncbi:transposase, partial [Naumannella halotolerans]